MSGLQAADSFTSLSTDAIAAIESHALSAKVTLASLVLYSIVRIFRYRNREKIKPIAMIGILLFGFFVLTGIYYTAAQLMSLGSDKAKEVCQLCADICDACGNECSKHTHSKHCQECAEACKACAEECRKM